jgi:uncharacterized protein (DUF1778 family)
MNELLRRTEHMKFRARTSERALIEEAAARCQTTPSDWMRRELLRAAQHTCAETAAAGAP